MVDFDDIFHVGKYTGYLHPMDGMGKPLPPFIESPQNFGGSLTRMLDVLLESLEGLLKTFHQPNATKKNQNTLEVQDY